MYTCLFAFVLIAVAALATNATLTGTALVAPASAQQGVSIIGSWSINWQGARDKYAGKLDVLRSTGHNRYYGRVTLLPSKGGTVTQEARIFVNGSNVDIECFNPSKRPYNPDRFYVTLNGGVMQGFSMDTAGQRGTSITFGRL